MQPDLDNPSLQELSNMLLASTREVILLIEMKREDSDAMRTCLSELEKIHEIIEANRKTKKTSRNLLHFSQIAVL